MAVDLIAQTFAEIEFIELNRVNDLCLFKDVSSENTDRWTIGSGQFEASDAFFYSGELEAEESLTIDLNNIEHIVLGRRFTVSWNRLKVLIIENPSASGHLFIGESGSVLVLGTDVINPLQMLATDQYVDFSGIYSMSSPRGFPVVSGQSTFRLLNENSFPVSYNVICMGVKND